MMFDLTTPCADCPFRRTNFIALRPDRVREIAGHAVGPQGGMFACHKSVHEDDHENEDDETVGLNASHCAGALIFAEKQDLPTQMMRIMERLHAYDRTKLTGQDQVFDNLRQMLAAHRKANR